MSTVLFHLNMRPPHPTVKEEKTIENNVKVYSIKYDNILPFLNEAMDSSLVKIYVFRSKETIKGALYLFLGFQGFILEEPLKGPEEVEI